MYLSNHRYHNHLTKSSTVTTSSELFEALHPWVFHPHQLWEVPSDSLMIPIQKKHHDSITELLNLLDTVPVNFRSL